MLPACVRRRDKAQFIIFATSGSGDPINANVPGTYEDPKIAHSRDPTMAPTPLTIAGQTHTAAAPWATLPQSVLDRTAFWHLMTNTPVHPKEPDVLKLMGDDLRGRDAAVAPGQAARAVPRHDPVAADQPRRDLAVRGAELTAAQALPIIPALALKATLTNPAGPLTNLQPLRDQTLNQLYDLYENGATTAQRAYIDSLVTSQTQVRNINAGSARRARRRSRTTASRRRSRRRSRSSR